jgi:phosphoglycolate phosphatase
MTAFKAIAFDYDGTLFDTRPAIIHCISRAFEETGRRKPAEDAVWQTVRSGVALPDTFLMLDEGLRGDRAALQDHIHIYRTIYLDEGTSLIRPFAGAKEVLHELHGRGIKCLVVSNKGMAAIRRSLDENGLSSLIDLVLGDEPGLPRKPDPAMLTDRVLPRYPQFDRQQILIVGDTETDILFAQRSGTTCCWASYGYGDADRCRALAPQHEISSITQLLSLIAGHRTATG